MPIICCNLLNAQSLTKNIKCLYVGMYTITGISRVLNAKH